MSHWLSWNVFFRLHEWAKGHATFAMLKDMEAVDRLSAAELQQLQNQRLQELMAYCYRYVPYIQQRMKQAGIGPSDIRSAGDLAVLPLMRKADVRHSREALRSTIAGKLVPFSTGGSTGEPLLFDLGKRRVASRVAARQRVDRWWGVSVGVPELAIWGSPLEVTRQDWLREMRDRLLRTRLLSAYEMNEATMSRYLDVLETGRYRQIFAYPSTLYLLCLHAQRQGRNLRRSGVEVIFVTSEVLFPYQRQQITETFGCPVANGYGGRDSGFIAHECPQGGMHLIADAIVTEIVDPQGRPVPAGESGEIVVTDLYSHEVPFIRYATGDMGVLSTESCRCGRPLPLLARLDGRSNDSVITPDGRIMHGQSLVSLVMEIEGIEQFRIVQQRLDRFHIQIVRNERFRPNAEERIRKTWSERLRAPLEVTFEYPASLAAERSGKFRYIVSEIPAGREFQEMLHGPVAAGGGRRGGL